MPTRNPASLLEPFVVRFAVHAGGDLRQAGLLCTFIGDSFRRAIDSIELDVKINLHNGHRPTLLPRRPNQTSA